LVRNGYVNVVAGHQKLGFLRTFGTAEVVVGRQKSARKLAECRLVVHE
jgi:hypothetical protein